MEKDSVEVDVESLIKLYDLNEEIKNLFNELYYSTYNKLKSKYGSDWIDDYYKNFLEIFDSYKVAFTNLDSMIQTINKKIEIKKEKIDILHSIEI